MLTTGKSGRYRYYSCAGKQLKGNTACSAPIRVPEAELDGLVTDALAERLLKRDRLKALMSAALKEAKTRRSGADAQLAALRRELKQTEAQVANLYEALANGMVSGGAAGFREHVDRLEARRSELARLIAIDERGNGLPRRPLTDAQLKAFGSNLSAMLRSGPKPFRKEYVRLLVDEVKVGTGSIRIGGSKAALAAAAHSGKTAAGRVPSFERQWRARQDSNLRPPD